MKPTYQGRTTLAYVVYKRPHLSSQRRKKRARSLMLFDSLYLHEIAKKEVFSNRMLKQEDS